MSQTTDLSIYLQPGTFLASGKYRIVQFIARGGFGITYIAKHVELDTYLCIKEFFPANMCQRKATSGQVTTGVSANEPLIQRLKEKFKEEAKALAKMKHPGIVHVSDVFEENDTVYYVMDLVQGHTLSNILNGKGPMPEDQALGYIRQVCDALKYVHSHKRLRLDIKPSNIMVDSNGNAILIDFGVSKQYDEINGQNTSTLMGYSDGYSPLEQLDRKISTFSASTDIYALGATLYTLLTGIAPPSAQIRVSEGEKLTFNRKVSIKIQNAIKAAMQVQRSKRPQTIEDFIRLLEKPQSKPASNPQQPITNDSSYSSASSWRNGSTSGRAQVRDNVRNGSYSARDNYAYRKPSVMQTILDKVIVVIPSILMILGIVGGIWLFDKCRSSSSSENHTVTSAPLEGGTNQNVSYTDNADLISSETEYEESDGTILRPEHEVLQSYSVGDGEVSIPAYLKYTGMDDDGLQCFTDGKTELYVGYLTNQPLDLAHWYCANEIGYGTPAMDKIDDSGFVISGYTYDGNIYYAKAAVNQETNPNSLYFAYMVYPESERALNDRFIPLIFNDFPSLYF